MQASISKQATAIAKRLKSDMEAAIISQKAAEASFCKKADEAAVRRKVGAGSMLASSATTNSKSDSQMNATDADWVKLESADALEAEWEVI